MCGIAGAINFKLSHEKINAVMFHRGPDEQAGFSVNNIDLYHLRLSILDIGGGKQPMTLRNRYTIVFNGEIYNHAEVRQQFGLEGNTHSDTETLLLLYEKFGEDFLQYLDGMFVFAIYDAQEQKMFLARDRAGKKPLYIFNDGSEFVFASELNALKAVLPLEIEQQHFYHYLRLGVFYRSCTPYQKVRELPAGTCLTVQCNNFAMKERRWWDIHPFYLQSNNDTIDTAIDKTDGYLHQAIKRRIDSSDLEVGCFLSGGIDSGLVTAIASGYSNNLKTFTVSFDGEYDEAPLAKQVASRYHTDHHEIRISFNKLVQDVEKIICNYGEPFFDSSAIPSYYVSEAAKKYVTVILNGDGADELFGGYRRYVPFAKYDFFKQHSLVGATAKLLNKLLPASHDKKSKYNYIKRLTALASKSNLEIYLSAGLDIIEDYEQNIIDTGNDELKMIRNDFNRISAAPMSGLKKIMNMDFDTNLFSDLLVKMDIATMAHSLEGRSPFLCKELLEYAPTLADAHKINGSQTKYLLRMLAKKYLPPDLIYQPKRGFEIPLKNWVNHELKDMIHGYLTRSDAYHQQLLKPAFVRDLLAQKINVPAEKRAKIIWTIFCMEVWYQKIYKSN